MLKLMGKKIIKILDNSISLSGSIFSSSYNQVFLVLSSWCLVMVEWLFLAVPWGCLRFVIVVFPDHTHLQFFVQVIRLFLDSVFGKISCLGLFSSKYIVIKKTLPPSKKIGSVLILKEHTGSVNSS